MKYPFLITWESMGQREVCGRSEPRSWGHTGVEDLGSSKLTICSNMGQTMHYLCYWPQYTYIFLLKQENRGGGWRSGLCYKGRNFKTPMIHISSKVIICSDPDLFTQENKAHIGLGSKSGRGHTWHSQGHTCVKGEGVCAGTGVMWWSGGGTKFPALLLNNQEQ